MVNLIELLKILPFRGRFTWLLNPKAIPLIPPLLNIGKCFEGISTEYVDPSFAPEIVLTAVPKELGDWVPYDEYP